MSHATAARGTITALVCLVAFGAYKQEYREGDVVPTEDHERWPAGMLAARLNHGYVQWQPMAAPAVDQLDLELDPEEDPEEDAGDGASTGEAATTDGEVITHLEVPDAAKGDKAALAAWAKTRLPDLVLDMRRGIDTLLGQVQEAVDAFNASVAPDATEPTA